MFEQYNSMGKPIAGKLLNSLEMASEFTQEKSLKPSDIW